MKAKNEVNLVMIGLDLAGKTTLLYKTKLDELITTIPTIGFNVETINHKGAKLEIWDIGGQKSIRRLWEHYLPKAQGIVFVVDSTDESRFAEASEELDDILKQLPKPGPPLLVLANKQDSIKAKSVGQITEELQLHNLKDISWYITGCSALSGAGIKEGLDWIVLNTLGEVKEKEDDEDEEVKKDTSKEHMKNQLEAIEKVVKYHGKLVTELNKVLKAGKDAKVEVQEDGTVIID